MIRTCLGLSIGNDRNSIPEWPKRKEHHSKKKRKGHAMHRNHKETPILFLRYFFHNCCRLVCEEHTLYVFFCVSHSHSLWLVTIKYTPCKLILCITNATNYVRVFATLLNFNQHISVSRIFGSLLLLPFVLVASSYMCSFKAIDALLSFW